MKKKIYISISLIILILIFTFVGYSIKSPSKVVDTYFQNIKSGTSNAITMSMFSSIDSLSSNSDIKEITDSLTRHGTLAARAGVAQGGASL